MIAGVAFLGFLGLVITKPFENFARRVMEAVHGIFEGAPTKSKPQEITAAEAIAQTEAILNSPESEQWDSLNMLMGPAISLEIDEYEIKRRAVKTVLNQFHMRDLFQRLFKFIFGDKQTLSIRNLFSRFLSFIIGDRRPLIVINAPEGVSEERLNSTRRKLEDRGSIVRIIRDTSSLPAFLAQLEKSKVSYSSLNLMITVDDLSDLFAVWSEVPDYMKIFSVIPMDILLEKSAPSLNHRDLIEINLFAESHVAQSQ